MDVAILGCGYVGCELGRLLADEGHDVVGVRRSDAGLRAIEEAGLTAVRADVTDANSLATVPDADRVVFAASAGGRDPVAARRTYVDGLRTAIDAFADRDRPPERLIYTGSTGVYGDHAGAWVDESTPIEPESERQRVLAAAERAAIERCGERRIDGTVARLAGLYGPGRYRIDRYLDGPVAEGYLNLVHRDDAAGAIAHLLENDLARGDVVLVVDDEPVSRWVLADWLADQFGRASPEKRTTDDRLADPDIDADEHCVRAGKRCSNARLRSFGYEFVYPTFREGYQDAIVQ